MKIRKREGMFLAAVIVIIAAATGLLLWSRKLPGVSVAIASRELGLLLEDKETIQAVEESKFAAGERSGWYVPYMDYLYTLGLLDEEMTAANSKSAAANLTMEELRRMADGLGIWQESEVWRKRQVTEEIWTEFLAEVMGRFDVSGRVQVIELSIYGTAANISGIPAWHVAAATGEYTFEGFSMDTFLDCSIQAWVRDREIIRVAGVVSRNVTYENMLVTDSGEDGQLRVYFAGYSRVFLLPGEVTLAGNQIIDLQLSEGEVEGIRRKNDRLDSRIIAVEENGAELEGYGLVPFDDHVRVYQIYGNTAVKSVDDIVIGYDIYDVVVAEGKICAVLIRQSPDARTIRVLLTDGSGSVKKHPSVTVTSDSEFTVTVGQQAMEFQAGDRVTVDSEGIWSENGPESMTSVLLASICEGQRVLVESDNGQVTITSLNRTFGSPAYPGTIEILPEDGGFYLINETLIEDYLCHVVPAEMPANYSPEALRAQAICARSFAVTHLSSSRYRGIGAHVDDTVSFQVYNYSAAAESTDQAVRDTYGEVLTMDGDIVTTYYFSTSCGYTSDVSLWGEDPSASPYLTSKRMSATGQTVDIRDEDTFREFIMDTSLNDYECNYGWYRWNTAASLDELTVTVNTRLANLSEVLKSRVLTRQSDGSWKEGAAGVGQVENVSVVERGAGGVASVVEIQGSEATVRLLLQSAIREVLGSADYIYQRADGSTATGLSALVSGYFCLEPVYTDGELSGYCIYGGGSGHGVGMPQNCANALGQSGVTAEEMLRFFYTGTEITVLY